MPFIHRIIEATIMQSLQDNNAQALQAAQAALMLIAKLRGVK